MHPLQTAPIEEEWSAVLLRPTPDVHFDLKGLHALALRGCWKAILEGRDEILHGSLEDHGPKRTFLTLAAFKTSNYTKAVEEFNKLEVPVASCSFGVRLLYALLPFFMENPRMAIDRLSLLLSTEKSNKRRFEMVLWCLVNIDLKLKNYMDALKRLNQLLTTDSEHQKAWFAVCCILLLLGDIEYAKECQKQLSDGDLSNVISGLCSFSEMDYTSAVGYFDKVDIQSDVHGVAANNRSICELFRCDNQAAMRALQSNLNAQPIKHMQEPLIRTLCAMYDLRGGFLGAEYIQKLKEWIMELIPDDFDRSMLL